MSHRLVPFVFALLLCAVSATPSAAGTISLGWDPVEHEDLEGYRIYYGTDPGAYTQSTDVGLSTSWTVAVADCQTVHLAVKAYITGGTESPTYSNEVSGWARPVVTGVSPSTLESNSAAQLVIDGANFEAGAMPSFNHPAITVQQVNVESCTRMVVDVSVADGATLGGVDLAVTNTDTTFGSATGLLALAADDSPPAITAVASGAIGSTSASVTWSTDEPATSQVFFRESGQSTFQTLPLDTDLDQEHAVTLYGLAPDTSYEYYVSSADASGNAADSSGLNGFDTLSSSFSYLRFEAEAGLLTAPVRRTTGAGAFRDGWVDLPAGTPAGGPSNPTGVADFGFHVPYSGSWHLWVRIYGPAGAADRWVEQVDDAGLAPVGGTGTGDWRWAEARSYSLAEGLHTFQLAGTDAEARVDRILVTDDPNFVPSERPGDDVTAPDAVGQMAAAAGDTSNVVSWTNPAGADAATIVVRYRTDGMQPLSPVDGLPLTEMPAQSGASESIEHTSLVNGTTYTYAVFAVDASGNASDPATAEATPAVTPPDAVGNLRREDTL